MLDFLLVAVGLVILTLAADWLVAGACALARRAGVSPLLIGLTIVAAGTSAPELVVSVQASFENNPGICVGNVVGSNIFNVAAILGIAAMIKPISVSRAVIRRDVPWVIGVSLLCWFFARDSLFSRGESAVLLSLLVVYTVMSYLQSRTKPQEAPLPQTSPHLAPVLATELSAATPLSSESAPANVPAEVASAAAATPADGANPGNEARPTSLARELGLLVVGLAGMILGSKLLLVGAISLAKQLGMSDEVIGLTLVAAGTSLPELATSVMAAWKGESEIAVGNVVGSSLFNILGILGLAGVFLPLNVSSHMLSIDIPVMVVVALAMFPIMRSDMTVSRAEGVLLFSGFVVYTVSLLYS